MAEQLGTAVLELQVDARAAEQALNAFRSLVESKLSDLGTGVFDDLQAEAQRSGKRTGEALSQGIKSATKGLKFDDLTEALAFKPQNTIRGLQEYRKALQALRDQQEIGSRAAQELNNRIAAVSAAIANAKRDIASLNAELARLDGALDAEIFSRLKGDLSQFGANLKAQEAQAKAAAAALQGYRQQAEGLVRTLGQLAAKGAGEAIKLPIFGLPKDVTDPIDKARAQIERLKKQAETASGKVARLSEGIAVLGAGGFAAKGIVDTLGGIGNVAGNVTESLAGVRDALASLPGPLKGLGGLDDIFGNGSQAISQWAASVLRAQNELTTLAGPLQAVTDALGALGPEAAAVGGALAFSFAGFQDLISQKFKPGIEGARAALRGMTNDTQALLEALARASEASQGIASLRDLQTARSDASKRQSESIVGSEENLRATEELIDLDRQITEERSRQFYLTQSLQLSEEQRLRIAQQLRDAAKTGQLALPSSQMLNAEGRGILRLNTAGTNDVSPEVLRQQIQAAQNLNQAQRQNTQEQVQLNAALEAGVTVARVLLNIVEDQTLGYRAQTRALREQLNVTNAIRQREQAASDEARRRLSRERQDRLQRKRELLEEEIAQRRAKFPGVRGPGAAPGLGARIRSSVPSAVIGGAFPLLFGQGIAASAGGGIGGLLGGVLGGSGGGFAGSLVGTAIGAQVDAAVQRLTLLGSALDNPIKKFQELAQAGLISSSALQKNVEALIASGREAEAAAQIQLDAARQFGDTSDLEELASATDAMNRSFAQLSVVLTKFVAGPLSDFLNKIARTNQLISGRQIFQERIGGLGLDAQQRRNVLSEARANTRDNPAELYSEALAIVDRIYGKTQQQLSLEGALSDAVDRTTKLRSISYRLVDAEAFGNQQLAFDLKKQQIELERINKLRALGSRAAPAAVEQINSQAALETYRLVQEQGKFARDLFESATKAVQSITRTLQDSTAQLLRLQGDPRAGLNRFLSTAAARGNVVAANQQLRPQFFTAANQAAQSFRNQGNELAAREIAAYANRIATATNVIERRAVGFIEANGIRTAINAAPPSTGAVGAQNKLFQDFIDVQRTEERLRQDIAGSNRELAKAQIDLATATGQLASPTAELASLMPTLTAVIESLTGKDWTVQVNVAADGSSKAFGDVLNGALN